MTARRPKILLLSFAFVLWIIPAPKCFIEYVGDPMPMVISID
jgi:hypothetical protein